MKKSDLNSFKEILRNNLPGSTYQDMMSPIPDTIKYRLPQSNYRNACVMALLHPKNDDMYLTFIKRASVHPKDKHAGQIGFPGGKYESSDKSLLDCALRETEEEIGISASDIKVLGELTSIYVFPSNFLVFPFVGYLKDAPNYTLQESEVADIFEISISVLFLNSNKTSQKTKLRTGIMESVPGYKLHDNFLWGATAMMTREIEEIVKRLKL